MKIFSPNQIKENINIDNDLETLINSQKAAFMDYSSDLYNSTLPMQFIFLVRFIQSAKS